MSRVTLGSKAVQQLRDTYARVRGMPFGGSGPRHEPRLWNPGIMCAIVTTPITACSGTSPGSGGVSIWRPIEGVMVETDTLVPVSNWSVSSGTVPNDTHVMIGWSSGVYFLVSRDCP